MRLPNLDMKLGFVSAILPDLSLSEVLRFARAENFSCVELMCWPVGRAERKYAGVTHLDVTHFTQGMAEDAQALASRHGVAFSGLGYYPNPLDPDLAAARRVVDHLKKVIRAAELLRLKNVNTFVGRDWTKSVDDNWPRFLKTWRPLVAFAADHGINIGIENCPMLFSNDEWPGGKNLAMSPAIWRRMFADIPAGNFGLNYDPSHGVLLRFDYLKPIREFAGRLFHVHAKDVLFDRDQFNDVGILGLPKDYHHPRIPGHGEIDWGKFMGALRAAGYGGSVCIEVEDASFGKTLEGRKSAIRVAGNVLRPFFG